MKIARQAAAGSLESSDILVTMAPGGGEVEIILTSSVENYYGDAIRETMRRTLEELGVTSARVEAVDHGALECTIKARITTAVRRAGEEARL
ncbi:MAG: citrate lyase acyl carrier protein [Oscillospiraceae bacterium]|nr:citrate lyase acyl carrier protein [Oscillospiraceae bacterium]MCI8877347.1 citrate lyase acyl carrier protein [Oscillospiraceae bacterium]